jgi:hypothetical protein
MLSNLFLIIRTSTSRQAMQCVVISPASRTRIDSFKINNTRETILIKQKISTVKISRTVCYRLNLEFKSFLCPSQTRNLVELLSRSRNYHHIALRLSSSTPIHRFRSTILEDCHRLLRVLMLGTLDLRP